MKTFWVIRSCFSGGFAGGTLSKSFEISWLSGVELAWQFNSESEARTWARRFDLKDSDFVIERWTLEYKRT